MALRLHFKPPILLHFTIVLFSYNLIDIKVLDSDPSLKSVKEKETLTLLPAKWEFYIYKIIHSNL